MERTDQRNLSLDNIFTYHFNSVGGLTYIIDINFDLLTQMSRNQTQLLFTGSTASRFAAASS